MNVERVHGGLTSSSPPLATRLPALGTSPVDHSSLRRPRGGPKADPGAIRAAWESESQSQNENNSMSVWQHLSRTEVICFGFMEGIWAIDRAETCIRAASPPPALHAARPSTAGPPRLQEDGCTAQII